MVDSKYVFHGYLDIIENFWELDAYDFEDTPWNDSDVIFVEAHEDYLDFAGENEVEVIVNVNGRDFQAFSLCGDGGFYAYLFHIEDYESLLEVLPQLTQLMVSREDTEFKPGW